MAPASHGQSCAQERAMHPCESALASPARQVRSAEQAKPASHDVGSQWPLAVQVSSAAQVSGVQVGMHRSPCVSPVQLQGPKSSVYR
jgi:hypothetical protein